MLNIEDDQDDHNHGGVSGKLLLPFEAVMRGCDEEKVLSVRAKYGLIISCARETAHLIGRNKSEV